MQLTGKQIAELGIVKGFAPEALQQQGIDVRVMSIAKVLEGGRVPAEGKTKVAETVPMNWVTYEGKKALYLQPGYYELTLAESCDIPNNITLQYATRSSLVRCGGQIRSGQFDAGFKTDAMGCFLSVECPFTIEQGARVAQAICFESASVDNTYNGQFQNDSQRK